jgi:D-alanyl-D-alanine carboxypeptidase
MTRHLVSFAAAAMVALNVPAAPAAAQLPPLDHDAVLAAIPGIVEAGAPSFVMHAVDEYGEWSAAAGVADLKTGVPASPDATFRIGSITKPMVAVAVLQLVAEGRLDLDVPVDTYLPGLLARGETVTLRHLLGHRSGMGYAPFAQGSYASNGWAGGIEQICNTTYDTVAVIRSADQQLFEPGTGFWYANAGYQVIQLVIEKVTGKSYQQVLTERIVVPLGLSRTSFQDGRPNFPAPFLHGYKDLRPGYGQYLNELLKDTTDCMASYWTAAGSGVSSARDITTFFRALTGGQLLPDSLYQQMIDTKPTFFGPQVEYGLGIMRLHSCVELLGHSGAVHGYQTDAWTTLDRGRTFTTAVPVFSGSAQMWEAYGVLWRHELCPAVSRESSRSTGTSFRPFLEEFE